MVFGHKCKLCGKDANVHHSERDKGAWMPDKDYWLCTQCDTAINDFRWTLHCVETDTAPVI